MRSLVLRRLAGTILVMICLVSPDAEATAQQKTRLAMSYVPANIYAWDVDVCIDKGFFAEQGFAPEVLPAQSSPQIIQLIVGRSADLALAQPEPVIAAAARGTKELGAFAEPTDRPDWLLVTRPEIKDWADLKGKRIGFSSLRVGEYWITRQILAEHGLKPNDYDAMVVGTSPLKLAALEKDSIAATVLFQPTAALAVHDGYRQLFRFSDVKSFPMVIYVVNRQWAAENDNGKRLSRAILNARAWLFNPENKAEALAIGEKYTKRERPILETVYDLYFGKEKFYSADGAIDAAGLARLATTMVENGEIPKDALPPPESYLLPKSLGGLYR